MTSQADLFGNLFLCPRVFACVFFIIPSFLLQLNCPPIYTLWWCSWSINLYTADCDLHQAFITCWLSLFCFSFSDILAYHPMRTGTSYCFRFSPMYRHSLSPLSLGIMYSNQGSSSTLHIMLLDKQWGEDYHVEKGPCGCLFFVPAIINAQLTRAKLCTH